MTNSNIVASPLAALIAGVKVKPLVWEGDETDLHDLIARPDPFHTYTVRPLGELRFDVILNHELGSLWFRQRKGEIWPDYASAKAAAQDDYERRILAALEAATPPDLVEAGEIMERLRGEPTWSGIVSTAKDAADLIAALLALCQSQAAQIAGLTKALEIKDANHRFIIDERDRTFSLMVERTEAAEAEQDYTHGTNEVLRGENQRLETEAATLRAEVERLTGLVKRAQKIIDPCYPKRSLDWQNEARDALEGKA